MIFYYCLFTYTLGALILLVRLINWDETFSQMMEVAIEKDPHEIFNANKIIVIALASDFLFSPVTIPMKVFPNGTR